MANKELALDIEERDKKCLDEMNRREQREENIEELVFWAALLLSGVGVASIFIFLYNRLT